MCIERARNHFVGGLRDAIARSLRHQAECRVRHRGRFFQRATDRVNGIEANDLLNEFVDETIINFEDANLETKYPDFRNLLKEYRDGILLFDLTDQKVWSKAVKDTAGLKVYYEKNKNNFLWDERADVTM